VKKEKPAAVFMVFQLRVNEAINDVKAIAMSGTLAMYYQLAINTWSTSVLMILKYLLTEENYFLF
jgi:hypothetical protein